MTTPIPSTFLAPRATWFKSGAAAHIGSGLMSILHVPVGAVLVAVDRVLEESAPVASLLEGLRQLGYSPVVVSDFGPELLNTQVDAAAQVAREADVQAVIGIGGGSVLDAAKMIALLVKNPGESDDWYGVTTPEGNVSPLVLVPTTVGTGAEVTRISMITSGGEKRIASSELFVPSLVVLDVDMVESLPKSVVASTALDALAHAAEAMMATSATSLTESHSIRAIELIVKNIRAGVAGDSEALANLLQGAYLAGLALNAGVVLGHSLGYAINHERPMPHGTTTGLALPFTIAYNQQMSPRTAALLSTAITGEPNATLRDAAEAVTRIIDDVGQPSSLDLAGVPEGVEEEMARRTVELYPRPTNPEPMDYERVLELLRSMRSGDLDAAFEVTSRKD